MILGVQYSTFRYNIPCYHRIQYSVHCTVYTVQCTYDLQLFRGVFFRIIVFKDSFDNFYYILFSFLINVKRKVFYHIRNLTAGCLDNHRHWKENCQVLLLLRTAVK